MKAETILWNAPLEDWDAALASYESALQEKALDSSRRTLVADDERLFTSWASAVLARSPPHLTKDDLVFVNTWKLQRGTFRPALAALVAQNTTDAVIDASTAALSQLDAPAAASDALCALRGVGPATASAILGALVPDVVPFMSDQLLQAVAGPAGKITYTKKAFESACEAASAKAAELGGDWTPRKIEAAVFAHAIHHPSRAELTKREKKRGSEGMRSKNSVGAQRPAGKRSYFQGGNVVEGDAGIVDAATTKRSKTSNSTSRAKDRTSTQ
jgi:hypothetical protein